MSSGHARSGGGKESFRGIWPVKDKCLGIWLSYYLGSAANLHKCRGVIRLAGYWEINEN